MFRVSVIFLKATFPLGLHVGVSYTYHICTIVLCKKFVEEILIPLHKSMLLCVNLSHKIPFLSGSLNTFVHINAINRRRGSALTD